jgi:hypothetical protein
MIHGSPNSSPTSAQASLVLACLAVAAGCAAATENATGASVLPAEASNTEPAMNLDAPFKVSLDPSPDATFDAAPTAAMCACGCGVFDVGTSSMLPRGKGGMAWLEFDHVNQNRNWRGSSKAPADDNEDKKLRSEFLTAGFQYMFNRRWGFEAEAPYAFRHFEANDGSGGVASADWGGFGDIRLRGIYTGFIDDMSLGVNFGLKLPTGDFRHEDPGVDVDRDTQIGSGSTDALLGLFYRHELAEASSWEWFTQVHAEVPMLIQDHYRPGAEFDQAVGLYYTGWSAGRVGIVPIGQLIASERLSDGGENSADPTASGYTRILLAPGIEFNVHPVTIYADVEVPVFQHVTGDQLTSPVSFKVIVGCSF